MIAGNPIHDYRLDQASATRSRGGRAVVLYLMLAVMLVPVVVPAGPGQTAIVDVLNLAAIAAFALSALSGTRRVQLPLLIPALVILVSSLIATVNAESVKDCALALAQDAYVYVWFVCLANVLADQGDLRALRIAWTVTAVLISGFGVWTIIAAPSGPASMVALHGPRASATFYNPNMLADYLVTSFFIALSLLGQIRGVLVSLTLGALGLGLIATKSNGGMLTLAAGLVVWTFARLRIGGLRPASVVAIALISMSIACAGFWATSEMGVGSGALRSLQSGSFLGRAAHSSESRQKIWEQLLRTYTRSPLGIGPGNSRWIVLTAEERERPDSFLAKEAHSDYMGFAIERGPIALIALLVSTAQCFGMGFWLLRRSLEANAPPNAGVLASAMLAAFAASTLHSFVIEKLHHRHFWLFLAMLCALRMSATQRQREAWATPQPISPRRVLAPIEA